MRVGSPAIGVGVALMVGVWAGTGERASAPAASQAIRHEDRVTLTAPAASASLADDGAAHLIAAEAVEVVLRPGTPPTGPARLGACVDPAQVDRTGACLRRVEQDMVDGVAWWDRTDDGLRQGWTVARVPHDGMVRVSVRVDDAVTLLDDGVGVGAAGRGWRGRDLHAWDARGHTLDLWPERTPDGFALVVDARDAEPPIEVDPTWEPWAWQVEGAVSQGRFAHLVRGVGDLNADGYDDVALTSAPGLRSPESVSVYAGGPAGLSTTPEPPVALPSQAADMDAADVNGDGQSDLVVFASDAVNIWLGNGTFPVGAATVAVRSDLPDMQLGPPMAVAPDINGDGYDEILVALYPRRYGPPSLRVYFGGPGGPSSANYQGLGTTSTGPLAGTGDLDGDGFGDIAIADDAWEDPAFAADTGWWNQHPVGRVLVYRGGPNGLDPSAAASWVGDHLDAAFGSSLSGAGDVNGDGLADVLVGSFGYPQVVDLFLGIAGGFAAAPAQRWTKPYRDWCFGCTLRPAGDWNGDGYDDVVLTEPSFGNGQNNEGRMLLYAGGPQGAAAEPTEVWESDISNSRTGDVLDGAGDVNGDGLGDLVFGAPSWSLDGHTFGLATARLGRTTPMPELPAPTLTSVAAWFLAAVGDTNGDGFADVGIGSVVYPGGPDGLTSPPVDVQASPPYRYGLYASDGAGDVNGDGLADVVVGGRGYACIATGVAGGGPLNVAQAWVGDARLGTEWLGYNVAGVGDVNGDGFDDVALAALGDSVWIVRGSPSGISAVPSDVLYADYTSTEWGGSLAGAGDVNGDGFADVLIGAYGYGRPTTLFGRVFLGGATGMDPEPLLLTFPAAADYAHMVVESAGDVNGDHYADVLVATLSGDGSMVGLYLGGPAGPGLVPDVTLHEANEASMFGAGLAPVGDINGDGYDDVLVRTDLRPWDHGVAQGSYVLGYWGGPSGLADEPSWGAPPWMMPSGHLQSLSGAGDVNHDGFDDFLVSTAALPGTAGETAVTLFYGGPTGPATTPSGAYRLNIDDLRSEEVAEGLPLTLTASVDYGGPGQPVISWDFGDGSPVEQGAQVTHAWADDGAYVMVATASTPGGTDSTSAGVRVINQAPLLLSAPSVTGVQDVPVHLTALASDVAMDTVTITWEILGRVVGTGPAIDHVFPVAGAYGVDLTVADEDGGVTQASLVARISPNLRLDLPPLVGGQPVTVDVRGATPGAHVVLLASPRPGVGPSCAPSGAPCVDLDGAVVLGGLTASPTGTGSLRITIPAAAPPGATLRFQAIEPASLVRSAVTQGVVR